MKGPWKAHTQGKYDKIKPELDEKTAESKKQVEYLEKLHEAMEKTYLKYDYTIKALHQFYIE